MINFTRAAAYCAAMAGLGLTSAAEAASFVATSSNFASIFAKAAAGDTIVLSGRFGALKMQDRSFATPLRIDASNARVDGRVSIYRMSGLSVTGGRFGSGTGTWQDSGTIVVKDSSNINFTRPVLTGDGLGKARGIFFMNSKDFGVTAGTYTGFRLALGTTGSNNGRFTNNRITRSTSDGINISDSHRITARGNSCTGTIPSLGAHADCIQLWSLAGNPVQSDIQLLYNTAIGTTQGFTSFDPDRGGGLRISMIGNRVDSIYAHGISCYNCYDSVFTDNVLTTMAGARTQVRVNIIGGGNNIIANNSIGPFVRPPVPPTTELGRLTSLESMAGTGFDDLDVQNEFDDFDWARAIAASNPADLPQGTAVPEPAAWLQLLIGFGLLGGVARRRSGQMRHQKAC